jgi:hypothetical protein
VGCAVGPVAVVDREHLVPPVAWVTRLGGGRRLGSVRGPRRVKGSRRDTCACPLTRRGGRYLAKSRRPTPRPGPPGGAATGGNPM